MKMSASQNNLFTVQVTRDELLILNNALNEVCHGIEVPEFSTRLGAELEEVKALLNQIGDTLKRTEGQSS